MQDMLQLFQFIHDGLISAFFLFQVKEVDDFKKKETEQENLKQAQKPNSSTPVKKVRYLSTF